MAINSVLEPGVTYLLIETYYYYASLKAIDSVAAQSRCYALGLNKNFPQAVLHGPVHLRGIHIPTANRK
jgi:hypothetical protein